MKKFLYLAVLLIGVSAAAATPPDEISEKVLKAFKATFTSAEEVTWKELDNSCQANFKMNQITVRAMYDNEGNLLETVRYYGENNLPPNIIAKLKKRYASKEVFGVTEVTSDSEVAYHITLKDEKHWYTVKSDPYANLQQTDKFKRADGE
jgi:hypothetical protein